MTSNHSVGRGAAALLVLALMLLAPPTIASAQTGTITGRVVVVGTDDPVPGAEITVRSATLQRTVVSRVDGRFTVAGLPEGTYTVEARRIGFAFKTALGVTVGAGAATLNFEMTPYTLRLEEVVVTGVSDPTAGVKVPFTVGRVNAEELPVARSNAVDNLTGQDRRCPHCHQS